MQNSNEETTGSEDISRSYMCYGAAVLVTSSAAFGVTGFVAGMLISAVWCCVFLSHRRPRMLAYLTPVVIPGLCAVSWLAPIHSSRERARQPQCRSNLHQIGLALHNYHDVWDSFPLAYTTDATGRPLHSWRVVILPYLDQAPLYNSLDLSEPWDSPRNRELLNDIRNDYVCPSTIYDQSDHTSYLAVTGDGTIWPGTGTTKIPEIEDGLEQTILIVEYDAGIPWAAPRDLEFEEAIALLATSDSRNIHNHQRDTFFYEYCQGAHVLFADGKVRFAPIGTDQSTWRGLLTINDGLPGQDSDLINAFEVRKLRVGNCLLLALLVILVLLPLWWVWRKPMAEVTITDESGAANE